MAAQALDAQKVRMLRRKDRATIARLRREVRQLKLRLEIVALKALFQSNAKAPAAVRVVPSLRRAGRLEVEFLRD